MISGGVHRAARLDPIVALNWNFETLDFYPYSGPSNGCRMVHRRHLSAKPMCSYNGDKCVPLPIGLQICLYNSGNGEPLLFYLE